MQSNLKMFTYSKCARFLPPQIRKFATRGRLNKTSHYDSLGISSKATQADVKSAYYKLSMVYHPDKNKDSEEAAQKFRDITEAYEVLGNVNSRKLYDRGLYFENGSSTQHGDIPMSKFYKSRDVKSRPPTAYGRTTVYDFDEWSKSHYGATFRQDQRFKVKERLRKQREKDYIEDVKSERIIFLISVLFILIAYTLYDKDYDNPTRVTTFGSAIIVDSKSDEV
jgi:DnaJ family protein C protein 30